MCQITMNMKFHVLHLYEMTMKMFYVNITYVALLLHKTQTCTFPCSKKRKDHWIILLGQRPAVSHSWIPSTNRCSNPQSAARVSTNLKSTNQLVHCPADCTTIHIITNLIYGWGTALISKTIAWIFPPLVVGDGSWSFTFNVSNKQRRIQSLPKLCFQIFHCTCEDMLTDIPTTSAIFLGREWLTNGNMTSNRNTWAHSFLMALNGYLDSNQSINQHGYLVV